MDLLQEIEKRDRLIVYLLQHVNPVAFQIFCIQDNMGIDQLTEKFVKGEEHQFLTKKIAGLSRHLREHMTGQNSDYHK